MASCGRCCPVGFGAIEGATMTRCVSGLCVLAALTLGVAEARGQASLPRDSLQQLVERGDPRVSAIVRQVPDSTRTTFTHLLRLAATTGADARTAHLATAHRLAL